MTANPTPNRCKRPMVHSNSLRVRLSPQLETAISAAATARGFTASEWLRQAAMTVATLEGVLFPDERADGKRRYARLEGGAIVDVQYLDDQPEDPFLDAISNAVTIANKG